MEDGKPKSIKAIGIAIMVLSASIIFSNGIGAMMVMFMGFGGSTQLVHTHQTPIEFIFDHYVEMCIFMVAIGTAYLFGGLFIQKCRLWANRFVTVISGILVLIVWTTMLIIRASFAQEPNLEVLNTWTVVVAVIWTIPFGLLIWFLNRRDVVTHFE